MAVKECYLFQILPTQPQKDEFWNGDHCLGEKSGSRMNVWEYVIITGGKLKCFKTKIQRGWILWKWSGGWQDKSWPTLGPTQFQTQTVKVPSIACFDLKNIFSRCSSFSLFPQQRFQQTLWRWWWHDLFCKCGDIFSLSDFGLARRKICSLNKATFLCARLKFLSDWSYEF